MLKQKINRAFAPVLRCILFTSTLSALPISAASAEANRAAPPHRATQAAIVPLPAAFSDGLVFVKVSINSGPAVWMDLDTGTTPSIVGPAYARQAGLTLIAQGKATGGFGSEKIDTFKTSTAMLSTGHESPRKVEFDSIELTGMTDQKAQPLAGLLGYSFLADKIVVIDYPNRKLFFREVPEATNSIEVPLTFFEGVPLVRVALDGHEVTALIDTGGTYDLLVTPQALKQTGLEHYLENSKKVDTIGHGGEQAATIGKAPTLTLGSMTIHDHTAVYTSLGTTKIPANVSLGKDFLKHYRVTLNYIAGSARFEPEKLGK